MPQRSEQDKRRLRDKAKSLIREFPNVKIDTEETTGANDFTYKDYTEAVGVVVDCGSHRGFVQISGQEPDSTSTKTIETSPSYARHKERYKLEWIQEGETCMLYGKPTAIFIVGVLPPDPVPPDPVPH